MSNNVSDRKGKYNVVHGPEYPSKKTVMRHVKKYASVTTAHGISYLAEDGLLILEKIFWLLVVCLAVVFMTFQTSSLYKQWQDEPVVTTLDTVALPIQELEFPAVTICPQGSIKSIAENVLFVQLERYLRNKRYEERSRMKRSDIPDKTKVTQSTGNGSWQMTYEEMMAEVDLFLEEVYPGAKDNPTKLVHLLTSDDPQKTFDNEAVLYDTYAEQCDPSQNKDALETMNKRLNNDSCPDDFEMLTENTCIYVSNVKKPYDEANVYCEEQGGSQLPNFETFEEFEAFIGFHLPSKYH